MTWHNMMQQILNDNGVTRVCLEVISVGISDLVVNEAMRVLMALLLHEGGNLAVQRSVHVFLQSHGMYFFEKTKLIIEQVC